MNIKQHAKQPTGNLPKIIESASSTENNKSGKKSSKTIFGAIQKFYICEIHKILKSFKRGKLISLGLSAI